MNVRIEVTGHNVFDRLHEVYDAMSERYAIPSAIQVEYADTFLRVPPPDFHFRERYEEPAESAA
jgi:hypothetical protein